MAKLTKNIFTSDLTNSSIIVNLEGGVDKAGDIIKLFSIPSNKSVIGLFVTADDGSALAAGATGINVGIFSDEGHEISTSLTNLFTATPLDLSVATTFTRIHSSVGTDFYRTVGETVATRLSLSDLGEKATGYSICMKLGANITSNGKVFFQLQYAG